MEDESTALIMFYQSEETNRLDSLSAETIFPPSSLQTPRPLNVGYTLHRTDWLAGMQLGALMMSAVGQSSENEREGYHS